MTLLTFDSCLLYLKSIRVCGQRVSAIHAGNQSLSCSAGCKAIVKLFCSFHYETQCCPCVMAEWSGLMVFGATAKLKSSVVSIRMVLGHKCHNQTLWQLFSGSGVKSSLELHGSCLLGVGACLSAFYTCYLGLISSGSLVLELLHA